MKSKKTKKHNNVSTMLQIIHEREKLQQQLRQLHSFDKDFNWFIKNNKQITDFFTIDHANINSYLMKDLDHLTLVLKEYDIIKKDILIYQRKIKKYRHLDKAKKLILLYMNKGKTALAKDLEKEWISMTRYDQQIN